MLAGVEVRGIVKSFGATPVLAGIDALFPPGRFASLLGPSGSGKTTLLRVIGGFVAPDAGSVRFGDADVTDEPVWRRNVGMVFQSYALFPHMSVLQNVAYGLNRRGIRGAKARQAALQALETVRLAGFESRRPKQLSGGQQQRVALARAIVVKPRVLLLDEPLAALDRRLRQDMQVELRLIQRDSGLTTIFVTHDQEEALTLSDSVAILDNGRIVQTGAPADIYERPRTRFAASFLGDANIFGGPVRDGGVEAAGALIRTADQLTGRARATLVVRPEKMRLQALAGNAPATDGTENRIEAIVTTIVYAGPTSTFLLKTDGGDDLKVFAQNASGAAWTPGQRVGLAWHAVDTVLVEDTRSGGPA